MSVNIIIAFLLSLCISEFFVAQIISLSRKIKLGDDPTEVRKIHKGKKPNLGGVGVFIGTMVTYFTFSDFSDFIRPDKLFAILIVLFFIGVKDDMDPINAWSRIFFEFLCAFFIIYVTNIRITSLYGIFYINELPYWASFALTSVSIVGCINSYNMIDGIDGLLGALSLLGVICFGLIFKASQEWLWTLLCVALCGSLMGFIMYNWQPAKIFMGNGGSMLMGTFFACFSLRIMQLSHIEFSSFVISMPHTIALSIIAIPVFDMITVFILRIAHGISPFKADNRHVHHRLLELGLQHWQATLVLVLANIVIIVFAYLVQPTGALRSLILTILFCSFFELLVIYILYRHRLSKTLK